MTRTSLSPTTPLSPAERGQRAQRYSRNIRLDAIGQQGQQRLLNAKALVVGCGGLGTPVIQYLAAAGVGHLTLVDDDTIEMSNLNRQTLHRSEDIGRRKAERAAEFVKSLDAGIGVTIMTDRLVTSNAPALLREHDVVIDCTDGLPSKYLLNDVAVMENKPLIHGGVTAWEGQVLYIPGEAGPCLRCLFDEVPPEGSVPSCQQVGVLGAACGFVGSLMALAAIRSLLGEKVGLAAGQFYSVDLLPFPAPSKKPMPAPESDNLPRGLAQLRPFHFAKRPDCPACGTGEVSQYTDVDYQAPRCATR